MRKSIFISLFVLLASTCLAQFPMPATGKVDTASFESNVLNARRNYTVYLPKSYSTDTNRKYPVLYLLHGMGDTNLSWPAPVAGNLVEIANKVIDASEACEMIIVMPDAGGNIQECHNGYFDMPNWPYETFFFTEFIPYIESHYRAIGDKEHRAISGLSMGGGGATRYGLKHPEMFSTVFAMSALMHIDKSNRMPGYDSDSYMAILTNSVIENSCVKYVETADDATKAQLKTVKWFVDCGDDDFLLKVDLDFFWVMKNAGIPIQFRIRNGGHSWDYWRSSLYTALPYISNNFGR